MSLDKFKAEELEEWRDGDITCALVKHLKAEHAALTVRLEEQGAAGDSPYKLAANAGRAAEIRDVLKLIETRGK